MAHRRPTFFAVVTQRAEERRTVATKTSSPSCSNSCAMPDAMTLTQSRDESTTDMTQPPKITACHAKSYATHKRKQDAMTPESRKKACVDDNADMFKLFDLKVSSEESMRAFSRCEEKDEREVSTSLSSTTFATRPCSSFAPTSSTTCALRICHMCHENCAPEALFLECVLCLAVACNMCVTRMPVDFLLQTEQAAKVGLSACGEHAMHNWAPIADINLFACGPTRCHRTIAAGQALTIATIVIRGITEATLRERLGKPIGGGKAADVLVELDIVSNLRKLLASAWRQPRLDSRLWVQYECTAKRPVHGMWWNPATNAVMASKAYTLHCCFDTLCTAKQEDELLEHVTSKALTTSRANKTSLWDMVSYAGSVPDDTQYQFLNRVVMCLPQTLPPPSSYDIVANIQHATRGQIPYVVYLSYCACSQSRHRRKEKVQ